MDFVEKENRGLIYQKHPWFCTACLDTTQTIGPTLRATYGTCTPYPDTYPMGGMPDHRCGPMERSKPNLAQMAKSISPRKIECLRLTQDSKSTTESVLSNKWFEITVNSYWHCKRSNPQRPHPKTSENRVSSAGGMRHQMALVYRYGPSWNRASTRDVQVHILKWAWFNDAPKHFAV